MYIAQFHVWLPNCLTLATAYAFGYQNILQQKKKTLTLMCVVLLSDLISFAILLLRSLNSPPLHQSSFSILSSALSLSACLLLVVRRDSFSLSAAVILSLPLLYTCDVSALGQHHVCCLCS